MEEKRMIGSGLQRPLVWAVSHARVLGDYGASSFNEYILKLNTSL